MPTISFMLAVVHDPFDAKAMRAHISIRLWTAAVSYPPTIRLHVPPSYLVGSNLAWSICFT